MRALVTGARGFVGAWLVAHLADEGDDVVPIDREIDISDGKRLAAAIVEARPDAVYHLAAFSHVGGSWDDPAEVFRTNALGTLNVLEAARSCAKVPRVLLVSSAEVYGRVASDQLPLTEEAPVRPVTPYAASKASAELLGLQAFLGYGVPVVRVRPFNHVGPGQSERFAVTALARRIVEAARKGERAIPVGDLSTRRDFTDVRDVVVAYRLLTLHGQPGEVYNVCSGHAVAIEEIATRLAEMAGAEVAFEPHASLLRPVDVPALEGSPAKIEAATGWKPAISLDDTLRAVVDEALAGHGAPAG
ncbi:MAG: GDP-mannose 4,6-dehydratase [Actinomycetota bacterium]|nr:GDP-mannose 4,6-dehydratase [Actinomycetota bacterium]